MCYAIPGRVYALDGNHVTIDYFGEKRNALNEIASLHVGDFVYAQGGYVIQIVAAHEAETILSVWKDLFFELQAVDQSLARLQRTPDAAVSPALARILDKALAYTPRHNQPYVCPLSDDELLYLLQLNDEQEITLLLKTANFLRQKWLGNACCVHGIIECSNQCTQACHYCGISTHNTTLSRYQMTPDEIVDAACDAVSRYGFKTLVLQTGEHAGYSVTTLCDVIRAIKARVSVLLFISFGEVGSEGLQQLYDAGARGLLMRFETSNPTVYAQLHPGNSLEMRCNQLREAFRMGYLVITGALIGLPGTTPRDVLHDIQLAKKLNAEMYSFGPFLPHPNTPLSSVNSVSENAVLKALAVLRMVDPCQGKILVTTGFETLAPDARERGLMSGGNSVMLTVTPAHLKKHYALYPHRAHTNETLETQIETTRALLKNLGRAPTDIGIKK